MFSSGKTPHPKTDATIYTALTVLALISVITQHGTGLGGRACVVNKFGLRKIIMIIIIQAFFSIYT